MHHGFWQAHRELFSEIGSADGTDASGTQVQTPLVLMSRVVIGERPFAPHKAAVVDLSAANATLDRPMDLILGYPTWSQADRLLPRAYVGADVLKVIHLAGGPRTGC